MLSQLENWILKKLVFDGTKMDLSVSQAQIRLGTCKTILGFSKSYVQWKKNCIFKLFMDLKYANENHTWDLDVFESIPHVKDEEWSHRKSLKPKVFRLMTQMLGGSYGSLSRGGRWLSIKCYRNHNSSRGIYRIPHWV